MSQTSEKTLLKLAVMVLEAKHDGLAVHTLARETAKVIDDHLLRHARHVENMRTGFALRWARICLPGRGSDALLKRDIEFLKLYLKD